MQVYLNEDATFDIEFREGGPQAHYRARHVKPGDTGDVLARWSADETGWREALPWERWQPDGA
jgi:hypothetical protein